MNLSTIFAENNKVAIAFSGGVDSTYLLYAALKNGAEARAYYVKSEFQPKQEYIDALRLAKDIGAEIIVLNIEILSYLEVINNTSDRCYYCKKAIFSIIKEAAFQDGYHVVFDGTNSSDDENDRPGIKALKELSVRSPLWECGLTKADIRRLSKEAGLINWDKPSYSCLATRISTGSEITLRKLSITEEAEKYLLSLGFSDFRIRMQGENAKIQVLKAQFNKICNLREEILEKLKLYYSSVLLDLETR